MMPGAGRVDHGLWPPVAGTKGMEALSAAWAYWVGLSAVGEAALGYRLTVVIVSASLAG